MALIEVINYARISLLINYKNAVFGAHYGTTFLTFVQSMGISFGRAISQINATVVNDNIENP